MPEFITIGETMMIFDPVSPGRLRYADRFKKRYGGAESNVAIGVSRMGISAGWISRVGNEELGKYIVQSVRGEGVDTSRVAFSDKYPTGLYVKEKIREGQNQVYYYRSGSAASYMSKDDIDWAYLKTAKMIHVSGITPFLSPSCRELIFEVMAFSKKHNITVSFDPNLRHKLMGQVKDHRGLLMELVERSDIFLPGLDEARYFMGVHTAEQIIDKSLALGVDKIAVKNGSDGVYYADSQDTGFVNSREVERVVDPIGAGDGFAAGVLSSLIEGRSFRDAVTCGTLIGSMAVTVEGDIEGLPTKEEMEAFLSETPDVLR